MKKRINYIQIIVVALIVALFCLFLITIQLIIRQGNNIFNVLPDNRVLTSQNMITFWQDAVTEPQINEYSPILGNADALITIFEYSSFGCPYSKKIQPIIKQVLEKYADQVKLVWKDLPQDNIYEGAGQAHIAARCAQEQGKFWQYHDQIWQNQDDLGLNNLKILAQKIDLNKNQFENCLDNPVVGKVLEMDIEEAEKLYISTMPHFYINNQELMGQASFEDFQQLIEIELSR